MVFLADRGDNRFRDQKRLRNSLKTDAANSSVASVVRSVLFGITRVFPFYAVNIIIVPFFYRAKGKRSRTAACPIFYQNGGK